jgi:hypothetical protein
MSERDILYKGKVKQRGIFNYSDFYNFAYDWLREEDYDVTEKTYSEKVQGDSKDVNIIWEADRKISDYFKFRIKMNCNVWGMKKIKVKKDGKEISMDSGLIEVKFQVMLIKDYEDRWENSPLWKFLRGIYERYIIKTRVEEYEDKAIEELNEFIAEIKAFLAIEAKQTV